ncbi:MAG: hypothetical protein R3A79_29805 [Nannocystaceae bacterium]
MTSVTSQRLHPQNGARFHFVRDDGEALRYAVTIYTSDGRTIPGALAWSAAGELEVDGELADGPLRDELVKLARPLRSKAPARMTRWRAVEGETP